MTKNEAKTREIIDLLRKLGACPAARGWVAKNGFTTVRQAWLACENLDWLSFVACRLMTPAALDGLSQLDLNPYCTTPGSLRAILPTPTLRDLRRAAEVGEQLDEFWVEYHRSRRPGQLIDHKLRAAANRIESRRPWKNFRTPTT